MSGEEMLKMSGEGFVFRGHKCPAKSQNVRRGIHGSPVKMSGEAQNHLTYSEHLHVLGAKPLNFIQHGYHPRG